MNRKDQIESIRPKIPSIIQENAVSTAERFQNQCLRPILKFQNELLIQIFNNYIIKRKGTFYTLSYPKQKEYISHSVQKDLKFRSFLIGNISGYFTLEEWQIYLENEAELRRRLLSMLIERLQGQIDRLLEAQQG